MTLEINSHRQLFIDDRLFDYCQGVRLCMNNPVQDAEPVFVPSQPWEKKGMAFYNTVLREGGTFRLWYGAVMKTGLPQEGAIRLCYAESADGLHWERPELGIVPFEGSARNNIVAPLLEQQSQQGATVCRDERAPAAERYKLWTKFRPTDQEMEAGVRPGLYAMFSADGLHWQVYPDQPNPPGQACDTQDVFFWDDRIDRYVGYTRVAATQHVDEAAKAQVGRYRSVGRITSPDFRKWSETQIVLEPDGVDRHIPLPVKRENPSPVLDFYTNCAMKYPWAQDVYLMFPSVFYHWEEQDGLPATMDVQLLTSRDGVAWNRMGERRPFLRRGRDGTAADGMLFANPWLTPVGEELWLFYTGIGRLHLPPAQESWPSGLYRARIRRDGFVSADAGYRGGEFVTPPLVFAGQSMEVNCDGSAGGWLKIAILEPNGREIPGFGLEEAETITGNRLRKRVRWRSKEPLAALAGRPVRLRIVMRDMKLYAFQFDDGIDR